MAKQTNKSKRNPEKREGGGGENERQTNRDRDRETNEWQNKQTKVINTLVRNLVKTEQM